MAAAERTNPMEEIFAPFAARIDEYQRPLNNLLADFGTVQDQPEELALYPWQTEAVEELRANIRSGVVNQILASPTGSGKTQISAYLIAECAAKRKRALFVVDRVSLINQTSALFDRYGIPHGVIQAQHWRARPWERIQIASAQTLRARGRWPKDLDLLVQDEAHGRNAYVDARIQQRTGVCIGLSATPTTRGLGKLYDAVVTVRTTNQLIADGYLAPFDIWAATVPDMSDAKVTAGEWSDTEASKRVMPIIGDVVQTYLTRAPGKKFIAFGAKVVDCEEMQRQFMAAGIICGMYTYRQGDEARAELLDAFRDPTHPMIGLISVAALARGFDAPDVECIIAVRPLRSSFAEHIQILGRGLRRDPANPAKRCIVLDHANNCVRFGAQMVEFFANGVTELDDGKTKPKKPAEKKEPAMRRCPTCTHVHARAPSCPMCGTEYPRPKPAVHLPGELTKLSLGSWQAAPRTATMQDKQQVYSQLLAIAQARRYKSGWVSHKYRAVFGVWPRGMAAVEAQPTPEVLAWVRAQQVQYRKQQSGSARQPHWRA